MENNALNENSVSSSKNGSKPYERKVRINQANQRKYNFEEDEKEEDKVKYQNEIQNNQQAQINNEQEEEIQEYIHDDFKKDEQFQEDEIRDYKNYQNIKNNNQSKEYIKDYNFQNGENGEYPGNSGSIQEKKYYKSDLNNEQYIPNVEENIQNGEYDDRFQYIEEGGIDENMQENLGNNYKYKYKYKKIQKSENEVEKEEENGQNEEGEENEELNEEEELKEEIDNIDLQEIKKKPGRILHQSTQETFDEEGNRIITRKIIKEFKQMTGGIRIRNIQNEKEKIEYERYTSNYGRNNKKVHNTRKTHSTYKSDNRGDRVYLLAQLAKLKNDAEKNKIKKNQIYSSQSPIIIHESNGYDIYENQNSIFSNDLVEPNSFEEDMHERNYRNNYGTVDNNYNIINNQEYREKFFYPAQQTKYSANGMQMQEEYFGENDSNNNRRDIPSPIGYIATYSSGSEDNEEMGKSYEQNTHKNYRTTHSKNKIDKNIFKKEGELIKKTEVVYELEDPNEYIGYERKTKRHNLSTNVIKAQVDTSKSDKRDFQSPDREFGAGSERFRKVTMAMISSLGPTCEDRKITRKMRSEVGGVVDLRQELNPVNTYKIKKFQRFGYNLNKEVNPKTKLEGAKIIQYWWRALKEKKIMMIKYIKIVKIQSVIRSYLLRRKIVTTRITYYFYETLESIFNDHYKKEILKLFEYSEEDKRRRKLINILQIISDKNDKQNKIKYFYKLRYITDLLKNKGSKSNISQIVNEKKTDIEQKLITEEIKETKITEEMYIKYIKEKYSNNNKSQRINELSIDKKIKKPYEIDNKTKYEIPKIKKELIDEQTQDDINVNKTIYKDKGTQKEKEKMIITSEKSINYIQNQPKTKEENIPQKFEPKQGEFFSIVDTRPNNEKEKINDIHLKPKEKEPLKIKNMEKLDIFGKTKTFQDFGTQNDIPKNEINNNNQISFLHKKKEMKDEYSQNEAYKPVISNNSLNIINKIEKCDESEQIGSWDNAIKKSESINFISTMPKKEEKIIIPNDIKKAISLEIIKNKKEFHDQEMQYIPVENQMQGLEMEIKGYKPKTKENSSQYIPKKPMICRSNQYSILMNKKKELMNKYLINKNNMTILSKKKALKDKGQQYDIPKEYKIQEIIIGNNIKRGITQKIIEILEEIWIKKEKNKFIKNCKEISRETMIKRELLRMALLRWRFIKGYGGDRYGVIYDRNGNEIGKKEGLVNDVSIQNDLDEEINNIKLKSKQLQNRISKQKPVYIKSNIIQKKKITEDVGTGDEPNNIIESKIDKITNISYIKKPKPKNKISNKNYFKINKIDKKLKDQGTYMPPKFNKIVKGNQLLIINKDEKSKNMNANINISRRRDLMIQIISKSIIREKYVLNDYFSKWFKKTMRIIEQENRYKYKTKKIVQPRISKTEKFEIITKKPKREKSAGPNKIVRGAKIEFKNKTIKKDIGILTNMPNMFKTENLKTRKINNDMYKSYKKPIVVKQTKVENNYTISEEKVKREISSELGAPIGKEIVDEINIRITEIFVKFLKSRTSPKCILRKYLSIWYRNSKYMPLLDNAKIIGTFCKSKLNGILVRKKWKKLFKKYLFTVRQYNIMKIVKKLKIRKIKIIRLIRMTRLITIFNKRKFLHYIMMYWLIYTVTTVKKRNQIKMLYENMLTTYVSMADDIFGKNKKNNPSIQDCMFEIIDTDKYQVKELEDVPIAKIYYSKKNGEKKIITNIKYIEKEIEDEKKCDFYKEMTKKYYSPNRYNNYKTDTDTKSKTIEKEVKSETRSISYKGIYNNKNNINNESKTKTNSIRTESKYIKRSNYNAKGTTNEKEGFAKYTYKGHQRTDSNNSSSKGSASVAVFKRRNNAYKGTTENKDSGFNSNINNRYSNLKNEEKDKENNNNTKSYTYKSKYIKNNYFNNNTVEDKQKTNEIIKEGDKSNYKNKYINDNKDGKDNEKIKYNNKYSNSIKIDGNSSYSGPFYNSKRFYKNEENK